jgi:hypothetical protein
MRENIGSVGAMRETTAPRVRSTPPRFGFNRCGFDYFAANFCCNSSGRETIYAQSCSDEDQDTTRF